MNEFLRWSGWTDRGKVRNNNEDAFLGLQFDAQDVRHLGKTGEGSTAHEDYVFAVSDGMGGAMAGEFASRITVEKVTRLLPRSYRQKASGLDAGIDDVLTELFDQIHNALSFLGQSYEECAGMGATLSLCWFTPGRMFFGHIGDSRIYYLPAAEGGMRQLSEDDTHVAWLLRNGKINEREARDHPRRNVLQKALGAGNQFVTPQVGAVLFEPGDRFLLCTDGVVDGFRDELLLDHLRSPVSDGKSLAQNLVDAAVQASGRDNTTALVVEVVQPK
ncbi:MAG: protein phosphatase 2C domain-containing protein [Chthoniobacteraceae bacterium]